MKSVSERINDLTNEACTLAEEEVERLARKILKQHSSLDEFCMAMGSWSFSKKNQTNYPQSLDCFSKEKYLVPLRDFIRLWDPVLHITGSPMRFTADGPKITDW